MHLPFNGLPKTLFTPSASRSGQATTVGAPIAMPPVDAGNVATLFTNNGVGPVTLGVGAVPSVTVPPGLSTLIDDPQYATATSVTATAVSSGFASVTITRGTNSVLWLFDQLIAQ